MLIMYGIKNCDSVKKARQWLETHHIDYQFHDYRQHGLDTELLNFFITHLGWQTLLNTRGLTWRRLSLEEKEKANHRENAIKLMLQHSAIIKRPILRTEQRLFVGFNSESYQQIISEVFPDAMPDF